MEAEIHPDLLLEPPKDYRLYKQRPLREWIQLLPEELISAHPAFVALLTENRHLNADLRRAQAASASPAMPAAQSLPEQAKPASYSSAEKSSAQLKLTHKIFTEPYTPFPAPAKPTNWPKDAVWNYSEWREKLEGQKAKGKQPEGAASAGSATRPSNDVLYRSVRDGHRADKEEERACEVVVTALARAISANVTNETPDSQLRTTYWQTASDKILERAIAFLATESDENPVAFEFFASPPGRIGKCDVSSWRAYYGLQRALQSVRSLTEHVKKGTKRDAPKENESAEKEPAPKHRRTDSPAAPGLVTPQATVGTDSSSGNLATTSGGSNSSGGGADVQLDDDLFGFGEFSGFGGFDGLTADESSTTDISGTSTSAVVPKKTPKSDAVAQLAPKATWSQVFATFLGDAHLATDKTRPLLQSINAIVVAAGTHEDWATRSAPVVSATITSIEQAALARPAGLSDDERLGQYFGNNKTFGDAHDLTQSWDGVAKGQAVGPLLVAFGLLIASERRWRKGGRAEMIEDELFPTLLERLIQLKPNTAATTNKKAASAKGGASRASNTEKVVALEIDDFGPQKLDTTTALLEHASTTLANVKALAVRLDIVPACLQTKKQTWKTSVKKDELVREVLKSGTDRFQEAEAAKA